MALSEIRKMNTEYGYIWVEKMLNEDEYEFDKQWLARAITFTRQLGKNV